MHFSLFFLYIFFSSFFYELICSTPLFMFILILFLFSSHLFYLLLSIVFHFKSHHFCFFFKAKPSSFYLKKLHCISMLHFFSSFLQFWWNLFFYVLLYFIDSFVSSYCLGNLERNWKRKMCVEGMILLLTLFFSSLFL